MIDPKDAAKAINTLTRDIIEHEDGPPPKKFVRNTAFPEPQKLTINKLSKEKTKQQEPQQELIDENMPLPPEPLMDRAVRYDFQGKPMTDIKESDHTINAGLHHHGDAPEKPGYALYELAVLTRSRNLSQRATAFETIYNIIKDNPQKHGEDLRMIQIETLCIMAYTSPTSITIQKYAGNIIMSLASHYKDPLSLYPYPAIPSHSFFTNDLAPHLGDILQIGLIDERILDAAALLMVGSKSINMNMLVRAPPSIPLMHVARSAYINWGEIVCQKQAIDILENSESDLEAMKEAAVVLRFQKYLPTIENLRKYPPIIVSIFASRADEFTQYKEFVKPILECAPDPFALEFLVACAEHDMITKEEAVDALKGAEFSQPSVTLAHFAGVELKVPQLPRVEEECWERRGEVAGVVEHILLKDDRALLPAILPCLFSYTNPCADVLVEHFWGIPAPQVRPVSPEPLFDAIGTCKQEELGKLLDLARYFPLHFAGRFFLRKDREELSGMLAKHIAEYPDPGPENAIYECDIDNFTEMFCFDGYENEAFQMWALMCLTQGAEVEVRHTMWNALIPIARFFTVNMLRKDHLEPLEGDMETIDIIIELLKRNDGVVTAVTRVGYRILKKYLQEKQGDVRGKTILERVFELPDFWRNRLTDFIKK